MRAKQTLSEFSWNLGSHHSCLPPHPHPRADPNAKAEEKQMTPMEIALSSGRGSFEMLIILAGFAELPAEKKLDFLGTILENEGDEQYAAEFKRNLKGFSVSEVGEVAECVAMSRCWESV